MSLETPHDSTIDCYRCGYDLRGIADDQACPECGLLAQRSRRATDELHETRPKWLTSISWGVNLILLAIILATAWRLFEPNVLQAIVVYFWRNYRWMMLFEWRMRIEVAGFLVSGVILVRGVFLLTRPEGYEPADQLDRRRRRALRAASLVPFAAIGLFYIYWVNNVRHFLFWHYPGLNAALELLAVSLSTIGIAPLVLLLFTHLRAIAKRAHSAHLAEHCTIIAFGTTAALVFVGAAVVVLNHGDNLFGVYWRERSRMVIILALIIGVLGLLFVVWSLYLLVRFAISFRRAARQIRTKWTRDDRAQEPQ